MTIHTRRFGKPPALQHSMQRGELFFDAIRETDVDEVLNRAKRISNIAFTAAAIAGEKLQLEGDGDTKRLVFAAYLNVGDLARTVVERSGVSAIRETLTSEQTHRTLLLASSALNSLDFGKTITEFRRQGAYYDLDDNGLTIDLSAVPARYGGKGCPYAKGNEQKAEYFRACTNHVVETYARAWERNMPRSIFDRFTRHSH